MSIVKNKILKSIENKIPFVIYKSTDTTKVQSIFQRDNLCHYTVDYSEKGFVFAPFLNRKERNLLIPFKNSLRDEFDIKELEFKTRSKSITDDFGLRKQHHLKLVQKAIETIRGGEMDKIVATRTENIVSEELDLWDIFTRLTMNNPNTFVYLWFHPSSGIWMGATPETLLKIKGKKFKTMALASTRKYEGSLNVQWNTKEQQEHKFVTDYIISELGDLNLEISKSFTVRAGKLMHICANVEGEMTGAGQLKKLISSLHPTPAVCGLPKQQAQKFILENENYNRQFYTGFLGEMNEGDNSNLFVNLRCMKIEKNQVNVFIGGGITEDSHAEKEWEETVLKTEIMRSVL